MKIKGTIYNDDTPTRVVEILEHARQTNERLIILYGDPITGRLWKDAVDERGYISRSHGDDRVPILIKKKNSLGGGAILDSNILEIRLSKGGKVLYRRGFHEK